MESTVTLAEAAVLRALTNEKKLTGDQTVSGKLAVTGGIAAFGHAVPTTQPVAITTVSGGSTVDAEARVAINAVLVALRANGLIAT